MSAAERHDMVPMKDYVDAQVRFALRLLDTIDQKNATFAAMVDTKNSIAINVALAEIKGVMAFHNDVVRGGERAVAKLTAEMVTRVEFKQVTDFVERSRQNAVTSTKFVGYLLTAIALAMTFGFGFANYLQSTRAAAIRAAEIPSSAAPAEPSSSSPRVVIPLPPARMDRPVDGVAN